MPFEELNKKSEDTVIILSLFNPILDEKLLINMIESADLKNTIVKSKGEVPGTAPILISKANNIKDNSRVFSESNMQINYNSQFNLKSLKDLRFFEIILDTFDDFYKWPIKKDIKFFSGKKELN